MNGMKYVLFAILGTFATVGIVLISLGDAVIPKTGYWHMHVVVNLVTPIGFEGSKACLEFTKTQEVQQSLVNMKAQLKAQLGDESRFTVELQCVGP